MNLKFVKAHWKSILWAFFIFLLCQIPGKDLPNLPILGLDKFGHFGLFLIFTVLLLLEAKTAGKHIILWLSFPVLYGALLELYQGWFVAGRTADFYDFLANSIGTICGFLLYRKWIN